MPFRTPVLWVLLLGACSIESAGPDTGPMVPQVDSIFAAAVRPNGPGCAVGVYRDGTLELARAYGVTSIEEQRPITTRTLFNLGSVAKQFTALAVLQLEEEGTLSLTDDVRRFVPELPVYHEPIRIRDLLQHTSGLRDYGELELLTARPIGDMAVFLDVVARQRTLNFTPGTRHEYSHSDYELLGLIVERASMQPFGQHLEEKVLQPLGMTASRVYDARRPIMPERAHPHRARNDGFEQRFPDDVVIGGGNLYTSVEDLAHWDKALADGAAGKHPLMARMLVLPTFANGDTIPYAWGIRRDSYRGLPILMRGGNSSGTRTEIIRFPEQHFAVAVLCNGSHLPPGTLGERVADRYLDSVMQPRQPPFAAPPPPVAAEPGELERFAGWYGDLEQLDQFTVVGGKLTERLGDTVQTWTYRGNGQFTADGSPEDFRLTFSGGPMRYVMAWRGEPRYSGTRLPESSVWQPGVAELTPYEGVWVNAELDLVWRVVVRDGTLMLKRQGAPDASLLPHRLDRFSARFGPWNEQMVVDVEFGRNPIGEVTGFMVSTAVDPAIRGLFFRRLP
ncbi:MAG: serine hydrolase domain-containing protein [Gemmatimonadales bacterium]|nr:serine hydrolase domain-containing protein [Gemmatimonadales bacterium]